MEGLKLLNGVFTAAFDTRGGLPNVINREIRLGFLTDETDIYDEHPQKTPAATGCRDRETVASANLLSRNKRNCRETAVEDFSTQ